MTLRQYNGKSVHFLLSDLSISQYSLLCEELCFLEKKNILSHTPKIGEKKKVFWCKIVIFHMKYPNNFRASLHNWKNIIFWRKIVIFHTKYPKNFHASLHSVQFFLSAPP
jgi:hypothetical protein